MLYCCCAQPIYLSYHSYISIGIYVIQDHHYENLNHVVCPAECASATRSSDMQVMHA